MIEFRLRTHISDEELEAKVGKILTPADYNVLLTGPTRVLKPDGRPLCVYLPGELDAELLASSYEVLHGLKRFETDNRGHASGMQRVRSRGRGTRTRTRPVASTIIGAFDPAGQTRYCRLTAWSGREWDQYASLFPLFRAIGAKFAEHVPDRWRAQMSYVERAHPEWVIPGTPFSTITVNNTYPTGVHTDKGDLDEGFSCLAVLRRGEYDGGNLTFPRYRVSADLGHGDLILMDAHEHHGNTAMRLLDDQAERISVVCYFRTGIAECGTPEEEAARAVDLHERRNAGAFQGTAG